MVNPSVRLATKNDLPAILSILNNEILHGTSVYDYEVKTMDYIADWYDNKTKDNYPLWVAELENEILGYATYGKYRPREGYKYTIEHSIYLTKSSQGKGIGRMLMQTLIESAINQNYHRMLAVVDASNEGSCEFHRKLGFTESGRLNQVGYKFDKWLDVVIMQLNLDK